MSRMRGRTVRPNRSNASSTTAGSVVPGVLKPRSIVDEYKRARNHKWYMTSRLITLNEIYSFDPNAKVNLDDFVDIIGRNFKQPKEGLGLDSSPSAHMWRTMMWPNRFL